MFRSTLLKTVRDLRWQLLGWGVGLALLVIASVTALASAFPDEASLARFARDVIGNLSAAQLLFGPPANLFTLPGLVEWRGLGLLPVVLGIFLVLAATGISRGREERGELDVVLAAERGRVRLFAGQAGGLALVYLLVCTAMWTALLLGGPLAGKAMFNPLDSALSVANYGLGAAMFGAFALLVAQFAATRRGAALAAGGTLVAAHIWANLGLVVTGMSELRSLSPLYLVGRSAPLATGGADGAVLGGMLALTLAQAALACWLFNRRDLGGTVRLPLPALARSPAGGAHAGQDRRRPTWLLGSVLGRGLQSVLGTAAVWGAGLGAFAILLTALAPAVSSTLGDQEGLRDLTGRFNRGSITSGAGFLSFGLFGFLPLLVTICAATLAAAWTGEERNGQLELDLAAPVDRRRYYLERAGAVLLALAVTVALTGLPFLLTAKLAGVELSWNRSVMAVVLLLPLAWVVAAAGFAIGGLRPGIAGAVLTPVLAVSFFFDLLAPMLGLPDAFREASVFHLYGQPLTAGIDWPRVVALLGMTVLFLAMGWVAFGRRDIAK